MNGERRSQPGFWVSHMFRIIACQCAKGKATLAAMESPINEEDSRSFSTRKPEKDSKYFPALERFLTTNRNQSG